MSSLVADVVVVGDATELLALFLSHCSAGDAATDEGSNGRIAADDGDGDDDDGAPADEAADRLDMGAR
jgi:hypothetical protein